VTGLAHDAGKQDPDRTPTLAHILIRSLRPQNFTPSRLPPPLPDLRDITYGDRLKLTWDFRRQLPRYISCLQADFFARIIFNYHTLRTPHFRNRQQHELVVIGSEPDREVSLLSSRLRQTFDSSSDNDAPARKRVKLLRNSLGLQTPIAIQGEPGHLISDAECIATPKAQQQTWSTRHSVNTFSFDNTPSSGLVGPPLKPIFINATLPIAMSQATQHGGHAKRAPVKVEGPYWCPLDHYEIDDGQCSNPECSYEDPDYESGSESENTYVPTDLARAGTQSPALHEPPVPASSAFHSSEDTRSVTDLAMSTSQLIPNIDGARDEIGSVRPVSVLTRQGTGEQQPKTSKLLQNKRTWNLPLRHLLTSRCRRPRALAHRVTTLHCKMTRCKSSSLRWRRKGCRRC